MRISSYFPISAATLLLTLLPTSMAQSAVSLVSVLPLEVRSPYLNFWTPPYSSSTNLNTTDFFYTQVVSDDTFPYSHESPSLMHR